ncbi:hypothetical protein CHLRE_06g278132v5 [Chlamydomonas reinhardtii]|uniref:Uncharacterized protein n=1 Tax=Chlamydomonas reinhardtii TaxID=3055 RepID=A0A2K3DNY5_CHLRE|nr:uncharacterized protein CHLRE_06g278132v5 [Chlamydomonas reinhardtii]PNW82242.1 hypothetical protein CHLRE_06g278132v5 [Chlamydomonas reinhardtii]
MAQPPQPQSDSMQQQMDQVDLQQRMDRLEEQFAAQVEKFAGQFAAQIEQFAGQLAAQATANAAALKALDAKIEEMNVEPNLVTDLVWLGRALFNRISRSLASEPSAHQKQA